MPSRVVTATIVPTVVAAAVRNGRHYPESLSIDNIGGAANHVITLQDEFTPNISNAVAAPVLTDIDRKVLTVPKGTMVVLEKDELAGVKHLGNLQVHAEAATGVDANCIISVGWRTD